MTDESKVKTTFIRPVNRTMSYEDRRGYVMQATLALNHTVLITNDGNALGKEYARGTWTTLCVSLRWSGKQ